MLAVISLGILRGGIYVSEFVVSGSPRNASLVLNGSRMKSPLERLKFRSQRLDVPLSVCRLGFAVAYTGVVVSLAMMCAEYVTLGGHLGTRRVRVEKIRPTFVFLWALILSVLWAVSFGYSVWTWSTARWDSEIPADLKPTVVLCIIFHGLSFIFWVSQSCVDGFDSTAYL